MKLTDRDVLRLVNDWHSRFGAWPERVVTTPAVRASLRPYTKRGNVPVVADVRCPPDTLYIASTPPAKAAVAESSPGVSLSDDRRKGEQ